MNIDISAAKEGLVAVARKYAPKIRRATTILGKIEIRRRRQVGDRYLEDFPRIIQLDDYSCGLQCALMVLRYFGVRMARPEVRKRLHTDTDGTAAPELRSLFRGLGFQVGSMRSSLRTTIRNSIDKGAPLIMGVDGNSPHWVVVYGYGPGRIYIADPSLARKLSAFETWDRFKERADGYGMSIKVPLYAKCAAQHTGTIITVE